MKRLINMLKSMISSIVTKSLKKRLLNQTIKEEDLTEVLREIRIALLDADVNINVVKTFIKAIKEKAIGQAVDRNTDVHAYFLKIIKDELVNILGKDQQPLKTDKKLAKIMLVGLQGSGKTTTVAKLAKFLNKQKQKNSLLVGLDVYRPAAINQLNTLAEQINMPFYNEGLSDPVKTAKNSIEIAKEKNCDLIIYDTAGRLQTNVELMNELVNIRNTVDPDEIILVVDGLSGQEIINIATEFNNYLKLSGIIITKLDSDARAGAALSLRSILNVPIKFTTSGEKLDAIELFYPERIADRILGFGDVMTLAEKAQEVYDEKSTMKTFEKMLSGRMDLEDLLQQTQSITKMGGLGSLVKMLPGFANKISEDKVEEATQKIHVWKILMSSMTLKERRNPKLLMKNPSRKSRIIKGSGRKVEELNKLLKDWQNASGKMEEIGRMLKANKNPFGSLF
ncbi:signal recognition particle protein Ffh [Mycoplasmoides gallisepticum CA06_2006.052-5-2P]|uniref:Signal recognition particle protein n=2 Tax=Mycoplasmoides gallisepticum TaxID=2096 RepID=J3TR14_MYCGL|nr:signal recognition particle protein [Mycoplasmoides gallisepticum]AFP77411.1 signal recognition particle protein Ffh [Mycoplasmoides gallisepticum NC96_1596-4-2P]AFP78942.1 signal recognition particle protein Ffh [Mycoplasmoides gallisepticum WI01_2001.043-13-2P]AFP75890.1 signal recognition particle protein Ffh [Mycoplasmoides gallisepticum VA94_7994-1-7P]AFP76657.1 signal recognition particle protein Ffh [Mycoplasmoides gallisepticum NC95_13295-2-2P]AFP78182.1 signal recognition particle 